jgi:UDP-N-acetylglucosamine--N-acetylmuramyl-(pentapeptide) pyrophosphoryl-undecaprenol N-acetylglucosamine transferase
MSQGQTSPVMILAGGTGGHVYPALAVAQRLMRLGIPVVWMGTQRGLEARVVPQAGIDIDWLSISGLRGKGVLTWLLAPLRLNLAIVQALTIMFRRKPRAVLGMGGFVAGPGGVAAFLMSRPLLIHEQNGISGLTNRLLAPLSDRLLEGFPNTFKTKKAQYVGNPVRPEIAELPDPKQRLASRNGALRLLILGGSQGAQALNEIVPQAVIQLEQGQRPEIWHQCGPGNIEQTRDHYRQFEPLAKLEAFIEDMSSAYAWADLVVCRAGALTIAELCAAGIGAILVPYPHAVDDHQSANAHFMVGAGAGILVQQAGLTSKRLATLLARFTTERNSLTEMAIAARRLAKPEATEKVANLCLEVAKSKAHSSAKGKPS